ncbi:cell division protein FtsZ [Brachyspira hyodysenteriae]|uniref:cell division protein FtsZ n=1 Tax=Brachyspira hyodysenteriae TaxID=159 RepID=UPI00063DD2B0|nr:cell division protein FtsZ [Brachyspira hyodysenteriae]KLI32591.1 cell division protein FtsZ [Brachyspira hyodysenteriae]MCZ9888620.1 cell division protein FtsZ [Brachyspira hyodysenteriae]MDA0080027.1 cell division protein FtsZ [Brachyspira hyodysenteriae]QTM02770.1 cell division protein FtsZ [Brachyspira hyodysenteriae]QTM07999.1 cell division protein FtsZ [Brachyspira hyodysenteriae]
MNPNYRIQLADNMKGSEKMAFNNDSSSLDTVIKVIGVGNGGCNAVNRMIEEGLKDVDFIAMNTDAQALSRSNAPTRIVLGDRVTQGLGAGTDPEKGAEAAREDIANIEEVVSGANLVFIASSFGGGTGTGASPVVAEAAKKAGALTIGVVTKPFEYEGKLKMSRAESGIDKMLSVVDSLIIIPNENLYDMVDMDDYSYEEALSVVDDILRQGVQGISDIITQTGFINVDFADVKTMISLSNGRAHLGIGVGKGDDRLQKAITNAFENPLLDVSSIKNARGILANIVCPKDFAMKEYREASKIINNYANDNANIKIGVCPKEDIKDEIIVTIVATGFDANSKNDSENKDVDSHANDIINKSVTDNKKDEVINNNSNSSNDAVTNKVESPAVENKVEEKNNDKKEENIQNNKSEINKVEINEKIIAESKTVSKNAAENISEIDNINTIVKEPEEEKEVELESVQSKVEVNEISKFEAENIKTAEKAVEKETIAVEEEKEEVKENVLTSNKNDVQETKEYKFENNIRNLKKPLIAKANRFIEEEDKANITNEENNNYNANVMETFNRTIVNNNSEYTHRYETKNSTINSRAVEKISEEMRFEDEEKHNNPHSDYHKRPFDIVSDDYMDKHNKMGSKMSIFGETSTVDNDLEKPAFLRRQIQARNTMR